MSEAKNPAANGGARTVANADHAGAAENITTHAEREARRLPPHRTPCALHCDGCPVCADPEFLTLVRCAPVGLLRALFLFLRAIAAADEDPVASELSDKLASLLEELELEIIAYAVLQAFNPQKMRDVIETVCRHAGWPPPHFHEVSDLMEEAAFWADYAGPDEHEAWAWVCVSRMSPARQWAFVSRVARGLRK